MAFRGSGGAPLLLVCMVSACGPGEESGIAFPTPWEDAVATGDMVDGELRAALSSAIPGAGWFRAPDVEGKDLVLAAVQGVAGATHPVLHIRIGGVGADGWNLLELDVALNHWVAGEVPVDGTAAVGRLVTADGDERFVVGGVLDVESAGVRPGDRIEATFQGLELARVNP